MTIYARSDIASVAISAAHGGCGRTHKRPAPDGTPVKVWGLSCSPCEQHLSKDTLWSRIPTEIPETPDEVRARENAEKHMYRDQQAATAAALSQLAKLGEMPAALSQLASLMAESRA